jgi:hypothetical protein
MKQLLLIICIVIFLFIIYKNNYKNENFTELNFVPRTLVGNASCMKDDSEIDTIPYMCKMNLKYSPVNMNVITVKYQNFSPNLNMTPSDSYSLLKTLTPSLTPNPLFSDSDIQLIGINKDKITQTTTLNDYKKAMKVTKYKPSMLFDSLTIDINQTASLEDENFLYLPDSIVSYIRYLNDLNLLQPFIDVNKINTIQDIVSQFQLYLRGLLIEYTKPDTNKFRLEREIVIIYSDDRKNILTIQFNQIISSDNSFNKSSVNINSKYDYFIPNSYVDFKLKSSDNSKFIEPIVQVVKKYGNALKSRQLIDDYDIDQLLEKVNNMDKYNILYVNFFLLSSKQNPDIPFGIQLVKREDGKLIYINYFDIKNQTNTVNYVKNMCPDPANNFFYKGRCYLNCPKDYTNFGLACILDNEKNSFKVNNLFDPESNFCKQICTSSKSNLSNYDQVLQQACWCDSMTCSRCNEFSIGNCNC